MFWLSMVINIAIQYALHPAIVGGNNFISLASALTGRAVAFLLLPLMALGVMKLITYFTKRPVKQQNVVMWSAWSVFFVVSTLSYL